MIDVTSNRNSVGTFVQSSPVAADRTLEGCKFSSDIIKHQNKIVLANKSVFAKDIDISWLAAASESYQVSADIHDYVIVDVPIVTVDVPNRNLQAFPFEEVSYFDPLFGKQIYQTFTGKPSHVDHQNKDPVKAKGVIFDSVMQYIPKWNVWKIRILQGFDRSKDAYLANQILNGERRGYSMGALCQNFLCSVCGRIETQHSPCAHLKAGKGSVFNGRLCYQLCIAVNYVECSSVGEPADITAETDVLWK